MQEIWILGDSFLTSAGGLLQELKLQQNRAANDPWHIFENYDVYMHPLPNGEGNQISKIRNNFANALMLRCTIPHTVVITLANGLDFNHTELQSKKGITKALNWLLTELKTLVIERVKQFPSKAIPQFKTRFLITRQLPKPASAGQEFKSDRRRFNQSLEKVVDSLELEILEANAITSDSKTGYFKNNLKLTSRGLEVFWKSVNSAIASIDTKKKTLKVVSQASEVTAQERQEEQENNTTTPTTNNYNDAGRQVQNIEEYFTRPRGRGRFFNHRRGHHRGHNRGRGRGFNTNFYRNWKY